MAQLSKITSEDERGLRARIYARNRCTYYTQTLHFPGLCCQREELHRGDIIVEFCVDARARGVIHYREELCCTHLLKV